jgi:hypothetical protein
MVKKNVSGTSYDRVLPCGLTRGYKLTVVWRVSIGTLSEIWGRGRRDAVYVSIVRTGTPQYGGLNACCLIIIGGGERSVGGRGECV